MVVLLVPVITIVLAIASCRVHAHGHMTAPPSRYAIGRDNDDHQRQPMQLRGNTFPPGWTTPLIPCGGVLKSQSKVSPTSVQPGQDLVVGWEMGYWTGAALHQGHVRVSIQPADANDAGSWTELKTISLVGLSSVATTPHDMTVTLPADLVNGGTYTLQWYWEGSVTPELYYNCADLVVGSGVANSGATNTKQQVTDTPIPSPTTTQPPAPQPPQQQQQQQGGASGACKTGTFSCDASGNLLTCSSQSAWTQIGTLGGCGTSDAMACVGDHFVQCAEGLWKCMNCAPGTVCQPSGNSIACGWPNGSLRKRDDEL